MSNTSGSFGQSNFDFSRPPPGYSPYCYSTKKYAVNAKTEHVSSGYSAPRVNPDATMGVYVYYDSLDNNSTKHAKSRSTSIPTPAINYNNLQNTNDLYAQIRQPPPPPPATPYPPNSEVQQSAPEMYLFSSVYGSYNVPPPNLGNSVGARQSLNQQQEEYQQQYRRDFSNGYYNRGGYNNPSNRKRKLPQEADPKKNVKKKKKPLSQNIPMRKDWSVEDAKRALDVEKEFNKRHKSQSLIIKFPDLELNRDIVSKFHTQIDSVHFQLPSNPRFCFVTLKDSANMDDVIKELNKIKFGYGYLTVEPKRDREEDINIGPEDIDPLTLYVGNLAQEVTVDDVVKAYPKNKRIDIGFAKKMKYTRYAFVCFRTVDDAIEAFQNTYATEMYSKSLIVRFRRLHGTVGLPGEPKPQSSQKKTSDSVSSNEKGQYTDHDFWKEQVDAMGISRFKQEADDHDLFDDFHDIDLPNLYETSRKPSHSENKYDSDSSNSESSHRNNQYKTSSQDTFNQVRVKEEPPDESVEDESFHHHINTTKQSHVPLIEGKIKNEEESEGNCQPPEPTLNQADLNETLDWSEKDKTTDVLLDICKHLDEDSDVDDSFFHNI